MRARTGGWMVVLALAAPAPAAFAQPAAAAAAYDRYVELTDERVRAELADRTRFLWIDERAPARRQAMLATVMRGDVALEAMETRTPEGRRIEAPGALIHHWIGTVFVPGVTASQAVAVLQDYDRYGSIYGPLVPQGRLISKQGDDFTFIMRFALTGIISAVIDTEQHARFEWQSDARAHSRVVSTRVWEVEHAGTRDEHPKPPESNRGYLWRLTSYWRFLERDGGTYIQCESISMSRSIPTGLGWIFGGRARAVPRDITAGNLAATRRYLLGR